MLKTEYRQKFSIDTLLFLLVPFSVVLIITYSLRYSSENQSVYLADAFNHGKLHFLQNPGTWSDTALVNGRHYWPAAGPFSAILLMPFVAVFGTSFLQAYIKIPVIFATLFLMFLLAKRYDFSRLDSLWLILAGALGSIFINIAFVSWVWQFTQALGVFFGMLSIFLYYSYRRWFLLGFILALLFATRFSAGFIIFFFLALSPRKEWFKLLVPSMVVILALLTYNFVRFGDAFEIGYNLAEYYNPTLNYVRDVYSVFDIRNIPTNIYYYFIKGPNPVNEPISGHLIFPYLRASPWGLSFFIVSPLFIKVLLVPFKDKITRLAGLTCLIVLFLLLLFRYSGFRQYGPRYFLDFFSLLYLILLNSFKGRRLLRIHKLVILTSIIINIYFFQTVY